MRRGDKDDEPKNSDAGARGATDGPDGTRGPPVAQTDGWTPLFNGKDLSGWDTYLGKPHQLTEMQGLAEECATANTRTASASIAIRAASSPSSQVDGAPAIRISGEIYGALITRAEYDNYHLRFEFKWGEREWPPREQALRDSGCCYHSVGPARRQLRLLDALVRVSDPGRRLRRLLQPGRRHRRRRRRRRPSPANPKSDLRYAPARRRSSGTRGGSSRRAAAERRIGQWNTLDLYCVGQTSVARRQRHAPCWS